MLRRLVSHLLIFIAVFCLIVTFYIWFLDSVLLNPNKLVPALNDAGVPSAVASILPDKATQDAEPAEKADMKAKIAQVVTPAYVDKKMTAIAISVTTFMREGAPQPVVDLSDFPVLLANSGVEVGDDIQDHFKDPIELNKEGKLDKLPQAYKNFKLLKIAGVVLFGLLLALEWWVAAKNEKMRRIGRIFLHSAIWFFTFWAAIIFIPAKLATKIKAGIEDQSTHTLIDAVIKAVQTLFGQYFLFAAIVCAVIALSLYLLRRSKKHVQAIKVASATSQTATKRTTKNT